jgi:hypothetical protein
VAVLVLISIGKSTNLEHYRVWNAKKRRVAIILKEKYPKFMQKKRFI